MASGLTRRGFLQGFVASAPAIVAAKNIWVPPRRLILPDQYLWRAIAFGGADNPQDATDIYVRQHLQGEIIAPTLNWHGAWDKTIEYRPGDVVRMPIGMVPR